MRPLHYAANLVKRMKMAKEIDAVVGPVKNEFHEDEKYCVLNSNRRKRRIVRKSACSTAREHSMFNVLDLNIWQASQLEVDKMNKAARHCESKLVEVLKEAWAVMPDIKILQAFEMRKDFSQEVLETEGFCPNKEKGRGDAPRVHKHEEYEGLRSVLGIP